MIKTFWRLRRQDYWMAAIELKRAIPELKDSDTDRLASYIRSSKLNFYEQEKAPTSRWMRITLPFGLIAMLILFILMPINYMIVGQWGYKWRWLTNWLRALGF